MNLETTMSGIKDLKQAVQFIDNEIAYIFNSDEYKSTHNCIDNFRGQIARLEMSMPASGRKKDRKELEECLKEVQHCREYIEDLKTIPKYVEAQKTLKALIEKREVLVSLINKKITEGVEGIEVRLEQVTS